MTDAERDLLLALADLIGPDVRDPEPKPFASSAEWERFRLRELADRVRRETPF